MVPPPFDSWPHGRAKVKDIIIHFRYAGSGPPLVLVHGNPQHSLTYRLLGPLLASRFTIICPDNRGSGDSSIPADGNYSSEAQAADLQGLLDFLRIKSALFFAHDKGCGPATALAALNPAAVRAIVLCEYVLPGFGYEQFSAPSPAWDLYANWQLAFFSVPEAAEFFIRGREKDMLSWYFWHSSYGGAGVIPEEVLDRYASAVRKPGFLRGMLGPFASYTVAQDNAFFARTIKEHPLEQPTLALGGEASIAPAALLQHLWGSVGKEVEVDVVPKAGHWVPDENPEWLADRLVRFFEPIVKDLHIIDLSWLDNTVTLV